MSYPTSIDSIPQPTPTSATNNPSAAGVSVAQTNAIVALETKLGTGASTPISGTVLTGNGTGTSTWGGTIGSGNVVLATSPTLVTPALGIPSAIVLTNATGFPTLNQNTTGNAATVTTNANLTGPITSSGNATSVQAGAIVPNNLFASTGTSWPLQAWPVAPVFSGITVGNGTVTTGYVQVGKKVDFRLLLTFGSSTTLPTGVDSYVSIPVIAKSSVYPFLANLGQLSLKVGGSYFQGFISFNTTTQFLLQGYAVSGTALRTQAIDTNNYGTPSSGSYLFAQCTYEAA